MNKKAFEKNQIVFHLGQECKILLPGLKSSIIEKQSWVGKTKELVPNVKLHKSMEEYQKSIEETQFSEGEIVGVLSIKHDFVGYGMVTKSTTLPYPTTVEVVFDSKVENLLVEYVCKIDSEQNNTNPSNSVI